MFMVPVSGTAETEAAESASPIRERKTAVFELQRVVVVFIGLDECELRLSEVELRKGTKGGRIPNAEWRLTNDEREAERRDVVFIG